MARVVRATPYAWPWHGLLDPGRSALVACLDRRWRAERPESDASDAWLARIAASLRAVGGLVVVLTATTSPRKASALDAIAEHRALTTRGGGAGAGVGAACGDETRHDDLVLEADVVLAPGGTSGFYASGLDDVLRSRACTDLVVAGWGLEGPVHSTLRAANDRGFECLLVADASTPVEPSLALAACEMVRFSGGIFGAVATSADLLDSLETWEMVPSARSTDERE